jgi:predicted transposase/invertase (TIGR01784 family)
MYPTYQEVVAMKERLVRFDWAMKKLLRNKANFEILEGFISELLLQDVKIQNILESEGNRQSADDKYNRVDLLTEIDGCELVLIELQVEGQYDYFHRMLYGTSKLITDYMDSGFSYDKVRKIVSINIVYFDLGHGEDYVYKGLTDFRGIHTNDLLNLSVMQKKEFIHLKIVSDIFPEYYILKVNGFNDVAKNSLDEWMFFLKNSEIKSEFKAKGLCKAAVVLDIMKLSKKDRAEYESYIEDRRVTESSVKTSWIEGKLEGKLEGKFEGKLEGKVEIALEMIKDGESNDRISKYTGLTDEQIDGLRMKNKLGITQDKTLKVS